MAALSGMHLLGILQNSIQNNVSIGARHDRSEHMNQQNHKLSHDRSKSPLNKEVHSNPDSVHGGHAHQTENWAGLGQLEIERVINMLAMVTALRGTSAQLHPSSVDSHESELLGRLRFIVESSQVAKEIQRAVFAPSQAREGLAKKAFHRAVRWLEAHPSPPSPDLTQSDAASRVHTHTQRAVHLFFGHVLTAGFRRRAGADTRSALETEVQLVMEEASKEVGPVGEL